MFILVVFPCEYRCFLLRLTLRTLNSKKIVRFKFLFFLFFLSKQKLQLLTLTLVYYNKLCIFSVSHSTILPSWLAWISQSYLLTLSWRRPLPYRNKSIDLLSKSMDWFLYDNGLCHERVKLSPKIPLESPWQSSKKFWDLQLSSLNNFFLSQTCTQQQQKGSNRQVLYILMGAC